MTTTIAKLKAQLGLNIPRSSSETDPLVINRLLEGFARINKRYADLKPPQIHASDQIRNKSSELFEELGPDLWPDIDEQAGLPSWHLYPSGNSDEQHQSRRYYSSITDRNL